MRASSCRKAAIHEASQTVDELTQELRGEARLRPRSRKSPATETAACAAHAMPPAVRAAGRDFRGSPFGW